MGIPINNRSLESYTVMHRDRNKPDYSKEDLRLIDMMLPHINRAFYIHNKLLRQQQQLSLYKSIVDNNPNPILLVDSDLNVIRHSAIAEHVLRRQSVLSCKNDKLLAKGLLQQGTLKDFVTNTLAWLQARVPEPAAIVLENGEEKLKLHAYPIHAESDFNDHQDQCCLLEIMTNKQPNWLIFAEEFGITPKELRTVSALYQGTDLNTIAK